MSEPKLLITEDGSHTLYLPDLDETYHSIHGARQESDHVFIKHGLQYVSQKLSSDGISIIEVGFGTGLNAWLSAIEAGKTHHQVSYTSLEAYPLAAIQVKTLNYPALATSDSEAELFSKIHETAWGQPCRVSADFTLNKLHTTLQDFEAGQEFDLCFYDAFAPSKQPEMWHIDLLAKLTGWLKSGGVFVTYCAKGQLKRDLRALGFAVETHPGPPGKKEMVRAIKNG